MEGKEEISKRRKSIMLIDKKGKAQEIPKKGVIKKEEGESHVKEEKGEESINSCEAEGAMDNKDKNCKCEMCATDENRDKCENCSKDKDCKCDSDRSMRNKSTDSMNSAANNSMKGNDSINSAANRSMKGNDSMNSAVNKSINNAANKSINNAANNSMKGNDSMNSAANKSINSAANRSMKGNDSMNSAVNRSMKGNDSINSAANKSMNGVAAEKTSLILNSKNSSLREDTIASNKSMNSFSRISNRGQEDEEVFQGNKSPERGTNTEAVGKTGALTGAGAGIVLGKSAEEEKKMKESEPQTNETKTVTIDENKNQEYSISRDDNKSIPLNEDEKFDGKSNSQTSSFKNMDKSFVPPAIPLENLPVDSDIRLERENRNIVGEGHMWKRRRIFACFWHEKYFVLNKDGILKYHKANGTKYPKGNWDLKTCNRIHEVFLGSESHPYRLSMSCDGEILLFAYDDPDTREFWYNQFSKFINF